MYQYIKASRLKALTNMIKDTDFEKYGFIYEGQHKGIRFFIKQYGKDSNLNLHYNTEAETIRLRWGRDMGFYAVLIASMKIVSAEELGWVFSRIPKEMLLNEPLDELSVATKPLVEPEPDNQIQSNQSDSKPHLSPSDGEDE